MVGKSQLLRPEGGGDPAKDERIAWAKAKMIERIDAEVERLLDHRETLDIEAIERDRAGAADRVGFEPSREAILARRHEAAAERAVYKAMNELRKVEAEARPEEAPAEEEPAEELGSFGPEAPRASAPPPVVVGGQHCPRIERRNEGPRSIHAGVYRGS